MSIGRYRHITAVGQQDDTACWAACLEWWARAAGRSETDQWTLIEEYDQLWGTNGTISRAGILTIIRDARWRMQHRVLSTVREFTPSVLGELLETGPVYTGFFDRNVNGNHVNVIYGKDRGRRDPTVFAMEPGASRHADGSFSGRHVHRRLSYYKRQGEVILGSPRASS